jgi:hypothetical protein
MRWGLISFLVLFASIRNTQQQATFNASAPRAGQTFVLNIIYKMDVDVVLKFAGNSLHNRPVMVDGKGKMTITEQMQTK